MSDDVLTIAEAADLLKVGVGTVRGLIDQGELPRRKIGRHLRLRRSDIDTYLSYTAVEYDRFTTDGGRRAALRVVSDDRRARRERAITAGEREQ